MGDESLSAVKQVLTGGPVTELDYAHCFGLLMAGRVSEASRFADDDGALTGGWSMLRGMIAKARGDLASAVTALDAAADLLDTSWLLAPCLSELATAHAMSGKAAEATRALRRAAGRIDRLFTPWFALSRAWATAADGDTSLATRQASAAADLAMAAGQYTVEATARYDVARLGDPQAACGRLTQLTQVVQGPLVPAMATAANALAHSDADALDRAEEIFAVLGMNLLAAEAATAASACRQQPPPAREAMCPGAATPLLRLTAPLIGLTRRERDVALLAGAGLTSQTIADRLRLSIRTVDNYLGRVYQKLGVLNRADLATLVMDAAAR